MSVLIVVQILNWSCAFACYFHSKLIFSDSRKTDKLPTPLTLAVRSNQVRKNMKQHSHESR